MRVKEGCFDGASRQFLDPVRPAGERNQDPRKAG